LTKLQNQLNQKNKQLFCASERQYLSLLRDKGRLIKMKKFTAFRNPSVVLASTAFIAIAASISPAHAQTAPAESETTEAEPASTDIIVTARRTDERLQDVPVAVTAFGGDALEERKISSETDLQIATPGLTVRQTGSSDQLNYAIRGQSIDSFSFSSPAVVTYFNEVQAGGGAATSFFDLASIQVLKGPQGTLFGRNATGGAVLYSSVKPSLDTGGYLKLGYGNYDNRELEGALNLGLAEGYAIRLSGKVRKRDGYQTNLLDGTHPNSIDSKVGRLSILIAPDGSNFENVAMVQVGRFGGLTGATKIANANGVNGTPATYFDPITNSVQPLVTNMRDVYGIGGPGAGIVPGFTSLNDFLTKQQSIGFYDFYGNSDSMRRGRSTLVSNTTKYELADNMTLKNIFGYNKVFNRENSDIDGSPYEFLLVGGGVGDRNEGYSFGTKQMSDELQLTGETGALTYILGGFISKEETYNRIPLRVTRDLGAAFLGPYDFTVTNKSKALYGQLTYALSDRLNLTGGLRYTWENVDLTHGPDSLLNVLNTLGNHSRKDSKPSWLVSLDYKVTDDLLVYASHRGSWRTGGFNGTSNNIANGSFDVPSFEPETTFDFEAGLKFAGDLGAMPARLNIAVYDQTIKDVQRAPYLNISALAGNVNKARVTGVEVDGNVELASWFEVGGAFTYTNARFTDPRATVVGANFIFGPYADTPEVSGSAYARLSTELGSDQGELALRAELYGQSHFFYSNLNNTIVPNARIAGYKLVNVRAEWSDMMGSGIKAAIYASNVTNKKYEVGGFPLGAVVGANSTLPGTPRMYGLELGIEF
jgi:iron complex outermembrane receptor protein